MTGRPYLKPGWMQRNVGNRLAPLVKPDAVSRLSVTGRRSGVERSTPVALVAHAEEQYLVAVFGVTDWALDVRAAGRCRVTRRGVGTDYEASEVPVAELQPILDAYIAAYSAMPHVKEAFRSLPDPAAHPTFRLVASPRDR